MPDGIEIAYGTCPDITYKFTVANSGFNYDCQYFNGVSGATRTTLADARDTDGDGRTDLEEMVGPGVFLTDPRVKDSDGDSVMTADTSWTPTMTAFRTRPT